PTVTCAQQRKAHPPRRRNPPPRPSRAAGAATAIRIRAACSERSAFVAPRFKVGPTIPSRWVTCAGASDYVVCWHRDAHRFLVPASRLGGGKRAEPIRSSFPHGGGGRGQISRRRLSRRAAGGLRALRGGRRAAPALRRR